MKRYLVHKTSKKSEYLKPKSLGCMIKIKTTLPSLHIKNFKHEIKILSYHLNSFHASNFCTSYIHASNLNPCIQWNKLICFQLLLMKWWQKISKRLLIIFSDVVTFFLVDTKSQPSLLDTESFPWCVVAFYTNLTQREERWDEARLLDGQV